VAHTADDQAETVLSHILRGTGLAGLGGIHPTAGAVIRPLLGIRRSELRAYLRGKKQPWREDRTNRDVTRMRARIRTKLLPLLEKQFQPAVVKHLVTLAELAREDEAFLNLFAESRLIHDFAEAPHNPFAADAKPRLLRIHVTDLVDSARTHPAIAQRMVRYIVAKIKRRPGQLGANHVDAVLELARNGQSGTSLSLPGGVEVRKERDTLAFRTAENAKHDATHQAAHEFEFVIDLARGSQDVRVPERGCAFRFRVIDWPSQRAETSKEEIVLDRDRLRYPLVLRNWRPGDRFCPLGHRSAHKLKRLLNEKRISRWERDGWPVLTSGGVLAWVRGFPAGAEFAADERTRAGILIAEEPI
jgi:tRNA(Ile)-lysidine synthase